MNLIAGRNCRFLRTPHGTVVSGAAGAEWGHPWSISMLWEERDGAKAGEPLAEWRAYFRPGFVNGRDAFISMPAGWPAVGAKGQQVPLTGVFSEDEHDGALPYLVLSGWRNPVSSGGLATSGETLRALPGEGYPDYFAELGVKPAVKGGDALRGGAEEEFDPLRTREIRAMDIVLAQPRIGTRVDVVELATLVDGQSQAFQTAFVSAYFAATGGRARLRAASKYTPPVQQSKQQLWGMLLRDNDPQVDEFFMATVYMVSQPDAGSEAEPDHTWEPHVKHRCWWNLSYATNAAQPAPTSDPLRLVTGLALGLADAIFAQILTPANPQYAEVEAFFNQANTAGKFWT